MNATNLPLFSVIVLCHNYGRYLGQCLESVFAQKGDFSLEVILVDDASSDSTPEVASRFSSFPGFVSVRHDQRRGHLRSANEGFALAKGEFILRLDADDAVRPDMFRQVQEIFAGHPDAGMVYGNFSTIDESSAITGEMVDAVHGGKDSWGDELARLVYRNYVCPPTAVVRRRAWEAVGFRYDETLPYSEDWWTWLRIHLQFPLYYCNREFALFRVHAGSLRSTLLAQHEDERCHRLILDRFFALPQVPPAVRALRSNVYASQYRGLADSYFGRKEYRECLRCLRICAVWDWRYLAGFQWWRRLLMVLCASKPDALRRMMRFFPRSWQNRLTGYEDPACKL